MTQKKFHHICLQLFKINLYYWIIIKFNGVDESWSAMKGGVGMLTTWIILWLEALFNDSIVCSNTF